MLKVLRSRYQCYTLTDFGMRFLQAINSLKNVESTALLQFLQPILNMLLHLIGDGGETLQVVSSLQALMHNFFTQFSRPTYLYQIILRHIYLHLVFDAKGINGYNIAVLQVAAFRAMVNILTR